MFLDTLQSLYFERMVGIASSDFGHIVTIGESIGSMLKIRKTQDVIRIQANEIESLDNSQKEDEDEINAVMAGVEYSHAAPKRPYVPHLFNNHHFQHHDTLMQN